MESKPTCHVLDRGHSLIVNRIKPALALTDLPSLLRIVVLTVLGYAYHARPFGSVVNGRLYGEGSSGIRNES